jgi:predicted peptidase
MFEKPLMTLLLAGLIGAVQVSGQDSEEKTIRWHAAARTFSKDVTISRTYAYALLLPEAYAKTEEAWPLLLFLHSGSGRGTDLERIEGYVNRVVLGAFDALPFVVVAPQLPDDSAWCPHALHRLLEDIIAELRIDEDRVYVTGWSRGGYGTWELAATYPEMFAAIMPMSARGVHPSSRLKDLHIRIHHGGKDESVPLASAESMLRSLKKKQADVALIVYPEANHGNAATTTAYRDQATWDWLLRQRRRR